MSGQLPSPPKWLKAMGPVSVPELSDRDTACMVMPDLDYDSQLAAIHHALRRHREEDQELEREIAEIDALARRTSGIRNEQAVNEWVDRLHTSVYLDAAHSMAAVGMLAPMFESVFNQVFQGIRLQLRDETGPPTDHERWNQPGEDRWDCHFVWLKGKRSKYLARGIMQLSDAVGLKPHLPEGLPPLLEALFVYRNSMFHCGFEWPVQERHRFAKRIVKEGWPTDWFSLATSGGEPWVFYMTDAFIRHCVEMIDRVICGIGAYCKDKFYPNDTGGEVTA